MVRDETFSHQDNLARVEQEATCSPLSMPTGLNLVIIPNQIHCIDISLKNASWMGPSHRASKGIGAASRPLTILQQTEKPSQGLLFLSLPRPSLPGRHASSHIRSPYVLIIKVEHKWLLLGVLGLRAVPYPGAGQCPRSIALPESRCEQRVLKSLFRWM